MWSWSSFGAGLLPSVVQASFRVRSCLLCSCPLLPCVFPGMVPHSLPFFSSCCLSSPSTFLKLPPPHPTPQTIPSPPPPPPPLLPPPRHPRPHQRLPRYVSPEHLAIPCCRHLANTYSRMFSLLTRGFGCRASLFSFLNRGIGCEAFLFLITLLALGHSLLIMCHEINTVRIHSTQTWFQSATSSLPIRCPIPGVDAGRSEHGWR